jgi:glycerol dehydrogenase-like iron-containing ADH family enzyme
MGFPGQYLQGAGALQYLGQLLVRMGYQRPAVLCDAIIADKILPTVAVSLQSHGIEATQLAFPGECTRAVIDLLACHARDGNPDVIVGLGGVKAVDTAKGISLALNVPVVICPTIASSLHAEQVAFGTLVQLVAAARADAEIAELLDLLCAVKLPVTLAQLGVPVAQLKESAACIASTTLNGQKSNLISSPLSAAELEATLLRADAIGASALW